MRSQPIEKKYYEEEVSAGGQSTKIHIEVKRQDELQRDFQWRITNARNQAIGALLRTRTTQDVLVTDQGREDNEALQSLLHARRVKTATELLPVLAVKKPHEHHNKYWQFSKKGATR